MYKKGNTSQNLGLIPGGRIVIIFLKRRKLYDHRINEEKAFERT